MRHSMQATASAATIVLAAACGGGSSSSDPSAGGPDTAFSWHSVTQTTVQAVPKAGYLVDNVEQVAVKLPPTAMVGDVVKINGVGSGGWRVAQSDGQSVLTAALSGAIGKDWQAHSSARPWQSIAASSDGMKLLAAASDGARVLLSNDGGQTWSPRPLYGRWSVAMSADGGRMVAVTQLSRIQLSSDGGFSWSLAGPNCWCRAVASSADGARLVTSEEDATGNGRIYVSSDWGARAC